MGFGSKIGISSAFGEDEESKGVTSKIKSQFANFSVLSLLARKTPEKEEKVSVLELCFGEKYNNYMESE